MDYVNAVIKLIDDIYEKDISMYNEHFLLKTIEKRCAEAGAKTVPEYIRILSGRYNEANEFLSALNITYSCFFRDPLAFALLDQWIIPQLIEKKPNGGEIRVWSAGCSYGHEAYSIAMLLDEHLAKRTNILRYRIFATDISQPALSAGCNGRYDEDSIQNIKLKYLNSYFNKNGNTYDIISRLKDHVCFSINDLLDINSYNPQESIFGDFDLVFCCNLLIYYRPSQQQYILRKVIKSMADNGYLITGEAEKRFTEKAGGLHLTVPPAAVFQKR